MRVFILGLTLIVSAFLYLGFSSSEAEVEVENLNQLPVEKKTELFSAFEKIASKREIASETSYDRAEPEEAPGHEGDEEEESSEFDAYLEERRESIEIAKQYFVDHGENHSDEERRELEQLIAELETAVEIIKVHMTRTDSDRAYELEDRFDEVLIRFESMMKE